MILLLAILAVLLYPPMVSATITLDSAQSFAVLGSSTVTNIGATIIYGNLGLTGSSVTGFPPGTVTGMINIGDAAAQSAMTDAKNAYSAIAALTPDYNYSGQGLGSLTLTPGVYYFSSSAQLTGPLTLNFQGNPNADFIFQIGTTLTTASSSSVIITNGGSANQVYWQVGTSATLGTDTNFIGNILADQSITLTTGANILDGRAFALNAAVTLDSNVIKAAPVPVPPTVWLLGSGLAGLVGLRKRFKFKKA
ncbi:MAG: hypothetical protein C0392_03140 [Syntrophus sp. (in: bacteria)]|nr:hypothetical protein [Syntrophus sp. (in: bacteria)]